MSRETRIYGEGEYQRIVILNHGGSETQVVYDSDEDNRTEADKEKERRKILNWWGKTLRERRDPPNSTRTWFSELLEKARK